jgi:hypothetical protein
MKTVAAALLLVVASLLSTGCQSLARPNWFSPGPAPYQQSRAQRFDPYPENEPGPEVVGARPRSYQHPLPEPSRARWVPWQWGR